MQERESREPVPFRRSSADERKSLIIWEATVTWRNGVYAAALSRAMDYGKTPDEARVIARQAYLGSFDDRSEAEFSVALGGMEVAPVMRRGRRAA